MHNPLLSKCALIDRIESEEGLVDALTEEQLLQIEKEIPIFIDKICFYRKNVKSSIDYYKECINEFIALQNRKLHSLDSFLMPILRKLGPQKTELSSLKIQGYESERVVIKDFHALREKMPEVFVTKIEEDQSCMTIRADKKALKEIWEKSEVKPDLFSLVPTITEHIMVKVKGAK